MPRTVLVADDNPVIRKMLCKMFEQEEDYDLCAEAQNGQEAIDLAVQHKPDLIVLDLSMPVMDGLEAARQLKRMMPNVPIILFTQHAGPGMGVMLSTAAVDLIVPKTEATKLMGHIRSLIPVTG
ncbi:MAG TPA: response regulator [Candidatus Acidoferrales bacterium]